jgi:uncharacterized protein (TIGR03067 family)
MVKRLFLRMLVLAAMLSCAAAASAGDESEKAKAVGQELKRLEGEWRIVAAEQGGEAVASKDRVVFSGRKCTVTNPETKDVFANTITIDPSKTPRQIEVTNTKTKQTWVGIYELKGDRLRAVFQGEKDGKRPTEFNTKKGSLEVMYTYERVKPK